MHRIVMTGVVALAALLGATATPAVTAAATPAVAATVTPAVTAARTAPAIPIGGVGLLPSVISCGSVRACLAVGDDITGFSGNTVFTVKPLAWNGSRWKTVSMPVPKGALASELGAVSCTSATFCLAVGNVITNAETGATSLYAATWNGTRLKTTATAPLPASYAANASFSAVSCLTARDCVALGDATDAKENTVDFAETWNGARWTLHVIAQPKGTNLALDAISCVSPTYCVLAGDNGLAGVASAYVGSAYAGVWNGKSFTPQKVPEPAKGASTGLTGVSCVSKSRCVAVGFGLTNDAATAGWGFTEVWNGRAWTAAKAPAAKADTLVMLDGVSCATAADCVAVGRAQTPAGYSPEAVSYNGKTWVRQAVPSRGNGTLYEFTGVSCPKAGDCVAIGDIGSTDGSPASLAGFWNGKSWKLAAA